MPISSIARAQHTKAIAQNMATTLRSLIPQSSK